MVISADPCRHQGGTSEKRGQRPAGQEASCKNKGGKRQAASSRNQGTRNGKSKKTASFLQVQKATLGTTGRCPEARSVLHYYVFVVVVVVLLLLLLLLLLLVFLCCCFPCCYSSSSSCSCSEKQKEVGNKPKNTEWISVDRIPKDTLSTYKSPLGVPQRGSTKVFSQKPGWKPKGPTYFGQNENLGVDMSHLGDVCTTLKKNARIKTLWADIG